MEIILITSILCRMQITKNVRKDSRTIEKILYFEQGEGNYFIKRIRWKLNTPQLAYKKYT